MGNIKEHIEIEDKYVLNRIPADIAWDRSVLVYQFFYENSSDSCFTQDKLVINMTKGTVSFCSVTKEILGVNKSNKKTEYKNIDEVNLEELLGRPFVLKRRHIKDNLFFDVYIHGKYPENRDRLLMLEIEHEEMDSMDDYADLLTDSKCVSNLPEYYNENMTVVFTSDHMKELIELRKILANSEG